MHVSIEQYSNVTHLPVDDTEKMLLSLLDGPLRALTCCAIRGLVLAVEQVVGRWWQGTSNSGDVVGHLENGLVEGLVNHDCAHIEVVVRSGRSMNDDRATATSTILRQGMGVIPSSSVGTRVLEIVSIEELNRG